jgi:hypothetical protein
MHGSATIMRWISMPDGLGRSARANRFATGASVGTSPRMENKLIKTFDLS